MYIPDYYEFGCPVNIVAGHDSLEKTADILAVPGSSQPMLLTDKGVRQAGLADIVLDAVKDRLDIKCVEDGVPPDSDLKVVRQLAQLYNQKGCDSIIAVGGGSVLDTAKGINMLVSEKTDDLMQFTGAGALQRKLRPLIAVPTTAGTGSEVTIAAVIADHEKNRKMIFGSHFLLPDAALIDSRMTLTLPAHIRAATAMDAMAHAVEACVMLSKNPLSDAHAKEAIRRIMTHLLPVIAEPENKEGRLSLALAAALAGIAFSNSLVGMVHALGHSVGSVCHVPHGNCMAILLSYGLEYNFHKVEERIADILFPLAGPEIYAKTPKNQRAEKSIDCIRKLNRDLFQATKGLHATCLKDLKDRQQHPMVPKEKLPEIAQTALGDGMVFYNPEDVDYEDWLMVLEAAWEGVPLDRTKVRKG
ncbi:MAG: iron-containing alcohol dehydrogenase [Desulfococcaceae bacterium]|jgi:alcohol dehydrogenase|nr:iron-containing alcohol dehydrogenase [Desulfococcaceae bacterium]